MQICNWVWKPWNAVLVNCNLLSNYWNNILLITFFPGKDAENFSILKNSYKSNIKILCVKSMIFSLRKNFPTFREILLNIIKLFVSASLLSQTLKSSTNFWLPTINSFSNSYFMFRHILLILASLRWILHHLHVTIELPLLPSWEENFKSLHFASSIRLFKLWRRAQTIVISEDTFQHNQLPSLPSSFIQTHFS